MSPRYITMKEPRKYRLVQKQGANAVNAVLSGEAQQSADLINSQIEQQFEAQEALTQVPQQNAFDSAVSLDQI